MSWLNTISNSSLKTLASSAMADQVMIYSEMLAILSNASTGGVSATEYTDLKSIYSNVAGSFASSYLQNITYNVIYPNTANAYWWGGAKNTSSVSSLGNLQANSSETTMSRLIGKWFLGTDLPMPIAGGDTATGQTNSASYNYAKATGSIFVNGISAADVNQGMLGDCYLLAALGSIAHTAPNLITNMFTDVGGGVYGVQFYSQGNNYYTTVNTSLPITTSGKLAFGGNITKSTSGELWVSLAEKAYVQMNTQFDVNNNNSQWYKENSYQVIEGGWAQPIKQITNINYRYYTSYYQGIGDSYDSGEFYSSSSNTYKQTIISALNSGSIGWIGTWGKTTGSNGKSNFIAGHAFMLLGYNPSTDKFIIRNPWGGSTNSSYNVEFEASITEFWNSSVKGVVALSDSTLADPIYTYTVTTDSASAANGVSEGQSITAYITRSSSGTTSTVYIGTVAGTAGSLDFAGLNKQAIVFASNETVKSVKISTYQDSVVEGDENFQVQLFKNSTDNAAHSTTTAWIKDSTVVNYSYTISTPNNTSQSAAAEGNPILVTITRSGQGQTSTVYLSAISATALIGVDTQDLDRFAVTFSSNETSKTVNLSTYLDTLNEGVESLVLNLYASQIESNAVATTTAFIQDVLMTPYSYAVISSSGILSKAAKEGGVASFMIVRAGSGSVSTVYVSTVVGTAASNDFVALNRVPVVFQSNQTEAIVNVEMNSDWWLETTEYFRFSVFETKNSTVSLADATAYIDDAPPSEFNYTVSSSAVSSSSAVTEGESATFTITRSGSGGSSTVFIQTASGTALEGEDFIALGKQAVTFSESETIKTITVKTLADNATESPEFFLLNLYRNNSDTALSTYGVAYIKDLPQTNYNYTISSNSTSASPITEGGTVTFTVSRSGAGSSSIVYVSTSDGNATAGTDYEPLSLLQLTFEPTETTKTVSVATFIDTINEGNEYFWLDLYKSYSDAENLNYVSYGAAYIKDASVFNYAYSVTTNASSTSPITEGNPITFTITRSGTGTASSVFVSTSNGSAQGGLDFETVNSVKINFAANETVKTITVNTISDSIAEGPEFFWLDLFKTSADIASGKRTSSSSAYINDAVSNKFTYKVSTNATSSSPVVEGGTVDFTITRSGKGVASTVYVKTTNNVATAGSDYIALPISPVVFAADETVKTVTVSTLKDSIQEGTESFWIDLATNPSTLEAKGFDTFATAYIKDGVSAPGSWQQETGSLAAAQPVSASMMGFAPNHALGEFKNSYAFSVILSDGSVVTWGQIPQPDASVLSKLSGANPAIEIYSNQFAFAALMQDGSVVTWGDQQQGGNSAAVAMSLGASTATKTIFSTAMAFAALRTDGSVITWGNDNYGGNSSAQSQLLNGSVAVVSITSNSAAFAAIRSDGSVVTWGMQDFGGNSTSVASALNGESSRVISISASHGAFAAIKNDGSVVTWGASQFGGDSSAVASNLNGDVDVVKIAASNAAFAAILNNGSVVAWGNVNLGGNTGGVSDALSGATKVINIAATSGAFAALRSDGSVVTWGNAAMGGNSQSVAEHLSGSKQVIEIVGNKSAFAAIRADGSVVTWGASGNGGDSSLQSSQLNGSIAVRKIYATDSAFAALRVDGSVVVWGDRYSGGDNTEVASLLNGDIDVVDIWSTGGAFAALRSDGKVITWGDSATGGNSVGVSQQLNSVVAGSDIYTNHLNLNSLYVREFTPSDDAKNVILNSDIKLTFNAPIQIGGGKVVLKTATGEVQEIFEVNSSQLLISNNVLHINPTKDFKVYTDYILDFEHDAIRGVNGNSMVASSEYNFKTKSLDSLYMIFLVAFNAAPGKVFLQQIVDAYNYGLSIKEIVNIFTTKDQFTSVYKDAMSNKTFADALIENVVKNTANVYNKNLASQQIVEALDSGLSRGDVLYQIFNSLSSKSFDDSSWGATSKMFYNQTVVSKYFSEIIMYSGEDLSILKGAIANVNEFTDVSTNEKIVELIGLNLI
jgi:predicted RNA-binding protein with TRAM domain